MQDFRMKTFLQVCEDMNYTRAAEHLCITQPAVSAHIRYLEKTYGVPLFIYERKKLTLTRAGRLLRDSARRLQHDEEHLAQVLRYTAGLKNINFGATLSVAEFMIPRRLIDFCQSDPDIRLHMLVFNTDTLLKMLDGGQIDFALVEGDFPKELYSSLLLSMEDFVAAGSPRAARQYQGASVSDLLNETLLLREEGSGSREILQTQLSKRGISLGAFSRIHEIASIGAIKELAAADLGITFLYKAAIKPEMAGGRLLPLKLSDFHVSHPISFIYRKGTIFEDDFKRIFEALAGK